MKPWQFAVVGLVVLAITGCRSDPNVALLERELRLKEDEIYRLRDTVRDLRECPQFDDRPAKPSKSNEADRDEGAARRHSSSTPPDNISPPVIDVPSTPSSESPDEILKPENLRGPSKPTGPSMNGPLMERPRGEVSSRPHDVAPDSRSASAEPFTPSGNSQQVVGIALNRALTGGINSGDRSGDQGLLVVVEPRDRAGRTIDAPAEMSVVVLDPAQRDEEGMASCAARWDFSAAETAAMFRRSGSNRAIHMMVTWPGEPPKHGKLHLFVRYTTRDGRKLEADQPIEVAVPGQMSARWDPAEGPARFERSGEMPGTGVADPAAQMATRFDPMRPSRPVWTPERQ